METVIGFAISWLTMILTILAIPYVILAALSVPLLAVMIDNIVHGKPYKSEQNVLCVTAVFTALYLVAAVGGRLLG